MTHARYLGLLAKSGVLPRVRRDHAMSLCAGASGLDPILDKPHLALLADKHTDTIILDGNRGAIIGCLFDGRTGQRRQRLDRPRQAEFIASGGRSLIDQGWGNYVALACDGSSTSILRAPFGDLPCLFFDDANVLLIASDLDLLARAGWTPEGIAWKAVVDHLVARDIARNETCLTGIAQLRGGDRLVVREGAWRIEQCWSPWNHGMVPSRIPDGPGAMAHVRDAVIASVGASVTTARHPLLMLSGGLDSSIVAVCLAEHQRPFTCFNLVSDDPSGDERRYARLVADRLGTRLIESMRQVANVDVTRSDAAHMPRPVARSFVQDSSRLAHAAARAVGADLIVDGGGGDNVFCALQSVAPVADALMGSRSPARIWHAARDIADIAEASLPTVLWRAVQRAWWRPPEYRWPLDTSFLAPDVAADAGRAARHPWLETPDHALPGKAAHIALIVAAQNWVESLDPQAILPATSPLVSQPVVEACLRVPSWLWFRDGRNRAIARDMLADRLPAEIVGRRSKASPDSFVAALFERNRTVLRTMLMDGALARHGLIDRAALDRALSDPRPAFGQHYRRIMRLADAEAWAERWI